MTRQGHRDSGENSGPARLATDRWADPVLPMAHGPERGVSSSLAPAAPVGLGNLLLTHPLHSLPSPPIPEISRSAQARCARRWRYAGEGLGRQAVGGPSHPLWGPQASPSRPALTRRPQLFTEPVGIIGETPRPPEGVRGGLLSSAVPLTAWGWMASISQSTHSKEHPLCDRHGMGHQGRENESATPLIRA